MANPMDNFLPGECAFTQVKSDGVHGASVEFDEVATTPLQSACRSIAELYHHNHIFTIISPNNIFKNVSPQISAPHKHRRYLDSIDGTSRSLVAGTDAAKCRQAMPGSPRPATAGRQATEKAANLMPHQWPRRQETRPSGETQRALSNSLTP